MKLSEDEYARIKARADQAGVSMPTLLVEAALAGDVRTLAERRALAAELLAVRRIVAAVHRNVDHLAQIARESGKLSPSLEPTMLAVSQTMERLKAATAAFSSEPAKRPRQQRSKSRNDAA